MHISKRIEIFPYFILVCTSLPHPTPAKERNSLDESVKRMQADFAKMQQELAMEKMKGEMIQREVKQQQMENKVAVSAT